METLSSFHRDQYTIDVFLRILLVLFYKSTKESIYHLPLKCFLKIREENEQFTNQTDKSYLLFINNL